MIEDADRIAVITISLVVRCGSMEEAQKKAERMHMTIQARSEAEIMTSDLTEEQQELIPKLLAWPAPSVVLIPEALVEGP